MAFDAKLAVFDFNNGRVKTKIRTPHDLISGFFQKSHDAGARISSNSWGARNGSYIKESRDLDHFVSTRPVTAIAVGIRVAVTLRPSR